MLRENAGFGQRNAILADALSATVAWTEEMRKIIAVEDLNFTVKKKAMTQLSPRERACSPGRSTRHTGSCSRQSASAPASN
ncbi:hypothetical protein [Paraburkholderia sp. GAS334]|uniref:hypothetical protein n=1 Tax=Paraburkholderia sp. GAS334 TaxID=3035131 RepID=UPI003D24787C